MRKILLIILLLFLGKSQRAQTNLDSLFMVWEDPTHADSLRTNAYYDYIWNKFLFSQPDSAMTLAQALHSYGEQHEYERAKGKAQVLMGYIEGPKGNFEKAFLHLQNGLKIFEKIGDKAGIARCYLGMEYVYVEMGLHAKGLECSQLSLNIAEEIGDDIIKAKALSNIGEIYELRGNYSKSLDYFNRSLKIAEESGNKKTISSCLTGIANIKGKQGNHSDAIKFYKRSLAVAEEIGNKIYQSQILILIGSAYELQHMYAQSLINYNHALNIAVEMRYDAISSHILAHIGKIYQMQNELDSALVYCNRSFTLADQIRSVLSQKEACKCLYETYKNLGKSVQALSYLEKLQVINDSLQVEETTKSLQQMEFAKQVFTDSLANVEKERLAEAAHLEEVHQKEKSRNIGFGIGAFFVLLSGGLYGRWKFVQRSKAVLQLEKDRSENLLLNILPSEIAAELKEKGKADARDYDSVSILFTDFKDFTQQGATLSAAELVSEINHCFEAFDGIIEKFGIEKIKTIGDAYMAAGGLPIPSEDSVKRTVLAALEMQDFISKRKSEMDAAGKPAFEMRVGIHTGPVVAGIVGVKKFQYDIWGDTVNTASRMESSGEVGKVNISQTTYELLKDDAQFEFENRGKIKAKGKGDIEMYFVSKT